MLTASADPSKNLLILKMEGFNTLEQLEAGRSQMINEVKKLSRGFTVINDISNFKATTPEGAEGIKTAQVFLVQSGMSKIIRITDNPTSKMQLNRISRDVGYEALEANSMQEALRMI